MESRDARTSPSAFYQPAEFWFGDTFSFATSITKPPTFEQQALKG